MLIEFSVANFMSFKQRATISMVASSITEFADSNVFDVKPDLRLTKGAVIFGANASGKSSFVEALNMMETFVRTSVEVSRGDSIPWIKRFKLSEETEEGLSLFEVIVALDGQVFRYGFEANNLRVVNEWLFRSSRNKNEQLFLRTDCRTFEINAQLFPEGKDLSDKTRNNALFLTVAAQFNGTLSTLIVDWFLRMNVYHGDQSEVFSFQAKSSAREFDWFRTVAGKLLSVADLGIEKISVAKTDAVKFSIPFPDDFPQALIDQMKDERSIRISTIHKKFNAAHEAVGTVELDLFSEGSQGTKKFFCLLGPIFNALITGSVLVIDELDTSLHSFLVWRIVQIFNSAKINHKNAQLLITTHDTTLLNQNLFRRDQMWFVEKDDYGASKLYSVVEFDPPVRKDASFEKDYLKGKYGAVPSIGSDFEKIVADVLSDKN